MILIWSGIATLVITILLIKAMPDKRLTAYPLEEEIQELNGQELIAKCNELEARYREPQQIEEVRSVILCVN